MDREQKSSGKEMHAGSRLSQIHWDKDGLPFLELKDGAALTPFHKDDAESFLDFERSRVPMAWEPPQEMTLAKTQSFIDRSIAKNAEVIDALRQGKDALADCPFCVIRSADGELMGYVGMHESRHPLSTPGTPSQEHPWTNKTIDVWYIMGPRFRGKGLTKAAVKALIEAYMEPVMRLREVGAGLDADHVVSHAILKGCGFEEIFKYERIRPGVEPIPRLKMARELDQARWD